MTKIIDPYGTELVEDYTKVVKEFGLDRFEPSKFPSPNKLMRRGVIFAGRDLNIISEAISHKKPFYVLSGIMPTADKIHLGTKMVVEGIKYFQEHGAEAFILVADLEASAARGVTLEEGRKRALEFHIPAYLALGLDEKKTTFYFQSENKEVMHMAYEFARRITLNEFRAVYGSADPGRIISAVTQVGDVLYPQLKHKMPGIIPVGIDQDCHIRLSRDVVKRAGEKRFIPVSAMYHKYTPSLDGSVKMSKSKPESCIELPEEPKAVCKKIMRAKTGGRDTVDEQRKLGGRPDICMVFELYKQHLVEEDSELSKIHKQCSAGKIICGECKQMCCDKMTSFLNDFSKKVEENKKKVGKLHFIQFK